MNVSAIYASNYKVPHVHRTAADGVHCNEKRQTDEGATGVDHYAPLKIPEEHNIYGPGLNNADHDNEKMYQNYNSLYIEQPVYNFIEELSTSEGSLGKETQPMYNVLEGPYLDDLGGIRHYGTVSSEEPVYTTLERPYQEGTEGPFNVSECINEPIYNVLDEGPYPSVPREDDVTYGA